MKNTNTAETETRDGQAPNRDMGHWTSRCPDCERRFQREMTGAVDVIVVSLAERGLDVRTCFELQRRGISLLQLTDEGCTNPDVSHVTIAAAAVYAADRLLSSTERVTDAEVAAAAAETAPTSKGAVATYAEELVEAYSERRGYMDSVRATPERSA